MKKKAKKAAKAKKPATAAVAQASTRRMAMSQIAGYTVAGAAIVGGAAWAVSAVRAGVREQDLSRLGQGVPAVVQVHDPSCRLCTTLQRNTRAALKCLKADKELLYLVANITTQVGQDFAARHRVPHVTLVYVDGDGVVTDVQRGVQSMEDLKPSLRRHYKL